MGCKNTQSDKMNKKYATFFEHLRLVIV